MLTSAVCCLTGLVNIIHEGNDSAEKYAPGSEERDIIRRFFVLCSHFKQGRNTLTAIKPHTAQASRCDDTNEPTEASSSTSNAFSGPDLKYVGSSTDLFFPHFWDDFMDLNMDQTSLDSMDSFLGDFRTAQRTSDADDVFGGRGMNMRGWSSTGSLGDYLMPESA